MAVISVRRAEATDAERIAEVHVRSWQYAYAGILSDDLLAGLSAADRVEGWRDRLGRPAPRTGVWVVELDAEVVGFACVAPSRDDDLDDAKWQELTTIYLQPEAWGTGAAGPLASACLDRDQAFFLWVLTDNRRAQTFYRKLGFDYDGDRRPITIGDRTVEELRMRRPAPVVS